MLRIKLVKSPIGHTRKNRLTVLALGLRKVNQVVEHNDHPSIRGMIHKVKHLLQVEESAGAPAEKPARASKAAKAPEVKAAAPVAEPKPEKKPKAAKAKAEDIAPGEPVEAGTDEQPPAAEPVGVTEES